MMGFSVKITTNNSLFDVLCPHYCRGCGRIGAVFCDCCKNYLSTTKISFNDANFEKIFAVGLHDGIMGRLVKNYKYESIRALADVLVELVDTKLPFISEKVVIVPLPTVMSHIRQRGFDHTRVLAKKIAAKRGWEMEQYLVRNKNSVQVGANGKDRRRQAKEAYRLIGKLDASKYYLLFDDVWTTGASMTEAARIMKKGGAKRIIGLVLAVNRSEEK